ncbi:HAL/PAL/TAL family ammonia-lyase [Massilia antarctica]|uniref:HAL/PAL/TAL family ammonia-lyase n=1 Tax=Massilia antarctica TaxID=2765360 RepID=UPI0006BB7B93|nr:aromatic amino acid ammonia-lyase [Massilia sp. H27-R4]MCY0912509.1 aromatic amino acid ammonia-lyase [Massilia sp. H27-R4]CUI03556.1 Putative histidine ammonia-lyase protein [Janthinobacterium sp. CG23_2]CUU27342.1 Putative histidine ammonia-lyase protein [Janthinobacterium sp. CG23_2]
MHPDLSTTRRAVQFDRERLTIEDIVDIARGTASAVLSPDPVFRAAIARGADFLDRLLREDGTIYGVTTGYGDSCTVSIPPDLVAELPHHLYTYHGCGLGEYLTPAQTRAVMATRLASLSKGFSGVSVELLEQIARLLDAGLLPLIPSEGSVGASGDLTPLSYLAAVLCGEREVWRDGVQTPAAQALKEAGITPLRLRPKEGLAIMNGTAVMTALACLAYDRAEYLTRVCTRITAMASFALDGNAHHFDETLFSVKPHAGMQGVAAWLRDDLHVGQAERNGKRLQDRYSIRCAPHVIGVLADALPFFRQSIENELNSANDNPIIDAEGERVLHGGHFYGGHIAFAMDGMKNAVANLADLLDRQMALLVDSRYNHGLPANLSGAEGPRAAINHGLKALQISSSAWTAEALKLTMPASVFSRSTECHNQDKVSMGTIAARDCLRVLELTEQVVAALLITVRQGVWLRLRVNPENPAPQALADMMEKLGEDVAPVAEDRRLEPELRVLITRLREQAWTLYA